MSIHYYLIHCDEHKDRETHIQWIQSALQGEVEIYKGYYTRFCSLEYVEQIKYMRQYDANIHFDNYYFWMPGQMGCYLSHHMIIKEVAESEESIEQAMHQEELNFLIEKAKRENVQEAQEYGEEPLNLDLLKPKKSQFNHTDRAVQTFNHTMVSRGVEKMAFPRLFLMARSPS